VREDVLVEKSEVEGSRNRSLNSLFLKERERKKRKEGDREKIQEVDVK
jgi:hypothetical protein